MTAAVASWLFAATWKGSVLIAFALVVHRLARNRVPSRWLCALLLVAVIRLVVPAVPATAFSIFNLVPRAAPAPLQRIEVEESGRPVARGVRRRAPEPPPTPRPWHAMVLGVWAAGVAFAAGRAAVQTVRFQRRLRDARPVDLGPILEECRSALHLRRHVRAATTGAVAAPSLHGFLRPTLLLPHGFLDAFTREQLRYTLLHELAHVRRSDVLVNWIATAAAALHWFNPLVHLALARLAEERELACDALALEALRAEERPAYGGTVLDIVDRLRHSQQVPALVGMTATPQQLKRRILMIASFKQPRYSILSAALVVAVGLLTLTDAQAHEPHVMKMRKPLTAEASAVLQSLEKSMNIDLRTAGAQDVVNAVANATGASIRFAEGVAIPETRLNVKGENIPAHIILFESLSSAGLGVKFTDTGIEIVKPSADDALHHGEHERVIVHKRHAGDAAVSGEPAEEDLVIVHQREAGEPAPAGDGHRVMVRMHGDGGAHVEGAPHKRIRVEAEAINDGTSSKKKVSLKGENGEQTGSLEVEVVK